MYGQGISRAGDLLDTAVDSKIIQKAGSWYSFEGERIGQGRENVKAWLEQNKAVMEKIEAMLLDLLAQKDEDYVPEEEPDIPEDDFNAIMDMLVDDDGVIVE
jgi:recombination protein RecA